jgi:hypothetical protein
MATVSPIRSVVVPFGNCVSDTGRFANPEAFALADAGSRDPSVLAAAQLACVSSCPQFADYCHPQRQEVATELWRQGAGLAVAGGEQVEFAAENRDGGLDADTLRWDLRRISYEPGAALNTIRRAVRAGQFRMVGSPPIGSREQSAMYAARLSKDDPEFYEVVSEELGDEASVGVEYVIRALCQQKDFKAFASQAGRGGSPKTAHRYDPGTLKPKTTDPIIKQFLREMLAIHSFGFSSPANKALRFPPKYYARLVTKFKTDEISWTDFDRIVSTYRNNPARALQTRSGRQHRIRSEAPDAPETYVRKAAQDGVDTNFTKQVESLLSQYGGNKYVTRGVVRSALAHSPQNAGRIIYDFTDRVARGLEKYGINDEFIREPDIVAIALNTRDPAVFMSTLQRFGKNVEVLRNKYGGDEPDKDFSDNIIHRLSRTTIHLDMTDHQNEVAVIRAAVAYKHRVGKLRRQAGGTLPDAFIRQYCSKSSKAVSYIEARREYSVKILSDRISSRVEHVDSERGFDSRLARRIIALYPEGEIDEVADNVFRLLNAGILVKAHGGMDELKDGTWQHDLDKIFDPRSKRYITFSSALEGLSQDERLALAHYYRLMPLLYGTAANTLFLENAAFGGSRLKAYFESEIAPKCESLVMAADQPAQPLSVDLVNRDLIAFRGMLKQGSIPRDTDKVPLSLSGVQNAVIVAGGRVFRVRERDVIGKWDNIDEQLRRWVELKVRGSYPAHERERAFRSVKSALQHGVLTVLGTSPGEYQLAFSSAFYGGTTEDIDRALIAHETGLDRLIYGSDLGTILESRLGMERRQVTVRRASEPALADITDSVPMHAPMPAPRRTRAPGKGLPSSYIAVHVRSLQTPRNRYSSINTAVNFPASILNNWGISRGSYLHRKHYDSLVGSDQVTVISPDQIGNKGEDVGIKIQASGLITMPSALGSALTELDEATTPIGFVERSGNRRVVAASLPTIAKRIGGVSLAGMTQRDKGILKGFVDTVLKTPLRHRAVADIGRLSILPDEVMLAAFPELIG